jgi:hypothetical protein
MDEDLDKKNRKLQEDPDDFDVKNSIFTQESMVSFRIIERCTFANIFNSVNLYPMKDMLKKSSENVLYKYSRTSVEH